MLLTCWERRGDSRESVRAVVVEQTRRLGEGPRRLTCISMKSFALQYPNLSSTLDVLLFRSLALAVRQVERFQPDDHACEMPSGDHQEGDLSFPGGILLIKRFGGGELH